VHERVERLRPRLPPRNGGGEALQRALDALLDAASVDDLAATLPRWAAQLPGIRAAQLHLDAGSPDRADAGPDVLVVDLGPGRARLELQIDAAAFDALDDGAFAWIDRLALRLRELLQAQELHQAVQVAQRRQRLQQALYAIADLAHADLDLHDMLGRVHRIVCDLTYAENFYLVLYDAAADAMQFAYDADIAAAPIARMSGPVQGRDFPASLTFAVLHQKRSLMGPSRVLREQLGFPGDDERLGPDCIDWLGVPMLEGDQVRGAVVVQSYDEARRYSEEDRALLGYVAQHILSAVTRRQAQARLEEAVQHRTAELAQANLELRAEVQERERAQQLQAALFRIVELASERGSQLDFFAGVHQVVGGLLDARNFFIALLSADGEQLEFPYFEDARDAQMETRRLANGATEHVLRTRRPLLAPAARIRQLIDAGEMVMFGTVPACWLGVPLLQGERAVGVMVVQNYESEQAYGTRDLDILQFASYHIATALERKQTQERLRLAYEELEQRVEERTHELRLANADLREQISVRQQVESRLQHEALHDTLTGLPNRAAMLARLARALARYRADPARQFAVLFLDLDRFKVVNDSVGHLVGDDLLVEAGRRLARCVREPDSVARLGGDEFTVLLEHIHGEDDAVQVAGRILAALVDPIRIGDKEIYTSASIGIALAHPRYARPEDLLRDADVAMYRAKSRGRQRYELFDAQLHEEALSVLDLESDLRRAITRREFEPYLQPIVRLGDGAVLGYEALLRWRHGARGLLAPSDFLSVAEDSGNIEQIDWQLYEQVLREIPRLDDAQAYVGINVSARHFRSPDLARALLDMLDLFGVAPARLRIEVTEGALLENPEQARETMLRLRESGILTSLDDFGTGYSSLSYLHRFPLHALKIDRSFVADLRPDLGGSSAAVVRAIRALAGSLGMEVIAEGIETPMQREALMLLECGIGQGFLFAEPRATHEILRAP
jgi:diguanylate cyclase (GGDEF)-like protein